MAIITVPVSTTKTYTTPPGVDYMEVQVQKDGVWVTIQRVRKNQEVTLAGDETYKFVTLDTVQCPAVLVEVEPAEVTQAVSVRSTCDDPVFVKRCGVDMDPVLQCEYDAEGAPTGTLVVLNFTHDHITDALTSQYLNLDGTPYTGDTSRVKTCVGPVLESDMVMFCVDGTNFLQHVVKRDGKPTADVYWTNDDTGALVADPRTGATLVARGACDARDYELEVLCDEDNTFLRRYTIAADGTITPTDTTLDGTTAYTPVGTVGPCQPGDDIELQVLCDDNTSFLRRYNVNLHNGTVTIVDTELDGATAYTPVGNIGPCQPDEDSEVQVLCDDNGAFLRRYDINTSKNTVATTDTALDGTTAYTVAGEVRRCDHQITVETGCLTGSASVDMSDAQRCAVYRVRIGADDIDIDLAAGWTIEQFVDVVNAERPNTLAIDNGTIVINPGTSLTSMTIFCAQTDWVEWDTGTGTGTVTHGTQITGTLPIHGIGVTYSTSVPIVTENNVYSHGVFPTVFDVPNNTTQDIIRNTFVTVNTITFDTAVANPTVVFASIGGSRISVPITFSDPVEMLFSDHVVQTSPTRIVGREGYVVLRVLSNAVTTFSFTYETAEFYNNFVFGQVDITQQEFMMVGRSPYESAEIIKIIDHDGNIVGSRVFSADGQTEFTRNADGTYGDNNLVLSTSDCAALADLRHDVNVASRSDSTMPSRTHELVSGKNINVPAGLKSVTINSLRGITAINGGFEIGNSRRDDSVTYEATTADGARGLLPEIRLAGGQWQWTGLQPIDEG